MSKILKLCLVYVLLINTVVAKTESQPIIAFTHARLIDGSSNTALENATILVKGDKIIALGQVKIPKEAKQIDLSGKTVMPALITTHSHLGLLKGTTTADSNNTPENVTRQLQKYAKYGVAGVTSLGRDQDFIYAMRQKRNTETVPSPYIFTAGQGIGVKTGAPPAYHAGFDPVYRPTTLTEVRRDIADLAKHKPDLVKIWVDNWWDTMPKMQPDIYRAVITEAHKKGLRVAAHIYYLSDAKALVNAGIDILEHSVRDLPVDQDLISAMLKHHTAYVPTLDLDDAYYIYAEHPAWMNTAFFKDALEPGVWDMLQNKTYHYKANEREVLALAEKNLKRLYDAGVIIAFGTDSGATPVRVQGFAEHRELQLLVHAGLTPMQAIKLATSASAKLLHANSMGTLAPGKKANFIILNANPLDDIRHTQAINQVWIDGMPVN